MAHLRPTSFHLFDHIATSFGFILTPRSLQPMWTCGPTLVELAIPKLLAASKGEPVMSGEVPAEIRVPLCAHLQKDYELFPWYDCQGLEAWGGSLDS